MIFEHLLIYLLAFCMSGEISIQRFAKFFFLIGLFACAYVCVFVCMCMFALNCESPLNILEIIVNMWFANICFPSFCTLLSHSVDCFRCYSEAFKIDVVPLVTGFQVAQ